MTNLLYLTFGTAPTIHWQASFSILSFLAHGWDEGEIVVMTDCPSAYSLFENRVKIITVAETQLRNWRGPTDNFFRAKIKALEACIAQSPNEDWLYLDADTFLFKAFEPIKTAFETGCPLLHLCEGRLSDLRSKTIRRLWAITKGRSFGGIQFDDETAMWNAGVIGLPGKGAPETIAHVLRVCDELCQEKIRPRLIEQLSFSVVLAHTGKLRATEDCIAHYWSNKPEWERFIAAFFAGCFLQKLDFQDILKEMMRQDFRRIPVEKKERKTKLRLVALSEKLFPDENKWLS